MVSKEEREAIAAEFVEVSFVDNGDDIEARLRSDLENCCPHCGGSGHKYDVIPFDLQVWQATHMAYTRELEPAVELADFRQLMQGNVIVPKSALQEVIRISDRKHPAWDAMKAALAGAGVKL